MSAVVARILSRAFEPVCVPSAEEALELVASGAVFDVIVSDLCLPGMSGAELFVRLRDAFPDQAARFMVLTGGPPWTGDGDLASLERRWLQKPMRATDLVTMALATAEIRHAA